MADTDIVTRLALEAGMDFGTAGDDGCGIGGVYVDTLTRFAALVAEECAKVAEGVNVLQEDLPAGDGYLRDAARAIRDRFAKP